LSFSLKLIHSKVNMDKIKLELYECYRFESIDRKAFRDGRNHLLFLGFPDLPTGTEIPDFLVGEEKNALHFLDEFYLDEEGRAGFITLSVLKKTKCNFIRNDENRLVYQTLCKGKWYHRKDGITVYLEKKKPQREIFGLCYLDKKSGRLIYSKEKNDNAVEEAFLKMKRLYQTIQIRKQIKEEKSNPLPSDDKIETEMEFVLNSFIDEFHPEDRDFVRLQICKEEEETYEEEEFVPTFW